MAQEYNIKNTQPAVMKDNGPYGTQRVKSKDGKYTANPNAGPEAEPEKDPFPELGMVKTTAGFDRESLMLDKKISTKLLINTVQEDFLDLYRNDAEEGQQTIFMPSTEFEDIKLGIDFFIGNAGQDHQLLINEPEVEMFDLKTLFKGLGNHNFFEHPDITLTLTKMFERDNYSPKNIFENNSNKRNTHYMFQIPYSDKRHIESIEDISEAKYYYVEKEGLKNFVKQTVMPIHDDLLPLLSNNDFASMEMLVKQKYKGTMIPIPRTNNRYQIRIPLSASDPNYFIAFELGELQEKDTGRINKEIRLMFPTALFNMDKNLKTSVLKFRKKFNWQ